MDFPTSQPDVGLVGGVFVDENPATGQPGSRIPASWGNQVTLELKALIESAGLEPSDTENDQVLQALQLIVERIAGGIGSLPLFMNGWHDGTRAGLLLAYGGRATPQDGVELSALTHPHIVKGVLAGHVASCTEAEWLADAYKRGMWSRGTAYLDAQGLPQGWVRGPDRNGVQEGSLPAQFWRGGADAKVGSIGKDTMRELTGEATYQANMGIVGPSDPTGVFDAGPPLGMGQASSGSGSKSLIFRASKGLPAGHTGTEFAPWHVFGCYYTITSNGVVNEGALDAAGLSAELLLLQGRVATLEGRKKALGDGQTVQSVVRTANTIYTAPNRAITVGAQITLTAGTGYVFIEVLQGAEWVRRAAFQHPTVTNSGISCIVFANEQYRFTVVSATFSPWEAR